MGKKSENPRKVVASFKALPAGRHWTEYLDEAVERQFPGIAASTTMTAKGYQVTVWWKDKTDRAITPKLHRAVQQFVAGFMACERSY